MSFDYLEWQREQRKRFVEENGFSTAANYATGGLRKAVLERDGYTCVVCRMTDAQHKERWNRPITIDHKDKNRKHNTMDNLQTLCLSCHQKKDQVPEARLRLAEPLKEEIVAMRRAGITYRGVAQAVDLSVGIIHRWLKIWNEKGRPYVGITRSLAAERAYRNRRPNGHRPEHGSQGPQ
jgi:hypothetical protein